MNRLSIRNIVTAVAALTAVLVAAGAPVWLGG
jgi:hypothetical protein